MKITLLLLFFCICINVSAQDYGYLVVDGDTTTNPIQVKLRKGEYRVSFQTSGSTYWHEIYPENAQVAGTDKELYLSERLPEKAKNVWVKCYFSGEDQLLEYKGRFYIKRAGKIYELKNKDELDAGPVNQYLGVINLLYGGRAEFDLSGIKYDPIYLVQPMISYHQKSKLAYRDYNNYTHIDHSYDIACGFSYDKLGLLTSTHRKVFFHTISPSVAASIAVGSNRLPHWMLFCFGVQMSYLSVDDMETESYGNLTNYYTFENSAIAFKIPISISAKIIDQRSMRVFLQAGVKVGYNLWKNMGIRKEEEIGAVVETEIYSVANDNHVQLFQQNQLLISFPQFSKHIGAGLSYSYALSKPYAVKYTIEGESSLAFFVRYTF